MTDAPAERDRDRRAVYDAEDAAFGGTTMDEPLTWDEVGALVAAITTSPWFGALRVPIPRVERARRDSLRSSADGTCVRLSDAGRDAVTVVHEIAHHVDHHLHGHDTAARPAHGPTFRAALVRVAALAGGDAARDQLEDAFRQRRLAVAEWTFREPDAARPRALRGAIPLPAASHHGASRRDHTPRVHGPSI